MGFAIYSTTLSKTVLLSTFWLVINWLLDIIVLVSLLGMAPPDYITQIGLRYLMIPAMVIAAGIIADDALRYKHQ